MEITSADDWQSTELPTKASSDITPQNETETNVDGFESLNMDNPSQGKMDINEFLYKPGEDAPSDEKIEVSAVTIRDMDEEDGVEEELNLSPKQIKKAVMETLPMDEIEAIVRAHTQELIKLNIQDQLPVIIEKIAREELDKILKEEISLKSQIGG